MEPLSLICVPITPATTEAVRCLPRGLCRRSLLLVDGSWLRKRRCIDFLPHVMSSSSCHLASKPRMDNTFGLSLQQDVTLTEQSLPLILQYSQSVCNSFTVSPISFSSKKNFSLLWQIAWVRTPLYNNYTAVNRQTTLNTEFSMFFSKLWSLSGEVVFLLFKNLCRNIWKLVISFYQKYWHHMQWEEPFSRLWFSSMFLLVKNSLSLLYWHFWLFWTKYKQ